MYVVHVVPTAEFRAAVVIDAGRSRIGGTLNAANGGLVIILC